jgi:hypothetical protein
VISKDLTEAIEAGVAYAPARELAAALDLQVGWYFKNSEILEKMYLQTIVD